MTSGTHIRAVDETKPGKDLLAEDAPLELDQPADSDGEWVDWVDEPAATARRPMDYLLPAVFGLAIAGWTGFFAYVRRAEILAGASGEQWIGFITQWAIPVLLVIAVWLLAMRLSRREAARFGDAAAALSSEARELETRLSVVNRELSLAREFLGEQSRELDFLGRTAADRLSTHADRLQALIHDNSAQLDTIASVSTSAVENMDRLRDDLPVIANSARDVTNRIAGAGREAHIQVADLVTEFERLQEIGEASEKQVASFRSRVDDAVAAFHQQAGQLGDVADQRFAALRDRSDQFRHELAAREVDALAAMRTRADQLDEQIAAARLALEAEEEEALKSLRSRVETLRDEAGTISRSVRNAEDHAATAWQGQIEQIRARLVEAIEEIQRIDALALENAQAKMAGLRQEAENIDAKLIERNAVFASELEKRQKIFADDEASAIAALHERLAFLDEQVASRQDARIEQARTFAGESDALVARIDGLGEALDAMAERAIQVESVLGTGADTLHAKLGESREAIDATKTVLADLTEASVRLLELIQAGSQHSKGELVESIGVANRQLEQIEERGQAMRLMLEASEERGKSLSDYVIRARTVSEETAGHIDRLHEGFDQRNRQHMHELGRLQEQLVTLSTQSDTLSQRARTELSEAIEQLEGAVRAVGSSLAETSRDNVRKLADEVGEESAKAVERALSEHTRQSISDLEQAAARASTVSREAAGQLRDQLVKVDELAGNLEARVARARERAEENTGNDFARRMALITESLNSNAIDISKALDSEIPDTTWASYLRGDRSIFTRRAVRLVDNVSARDIAEIYDNDTAFRDQVARYVADFEAMLRSVLSTRDGNALGVTLLGSDMGKLYVVLAQAIERLRD